MKRDMNEKNKNWKKPFFLSEVDELLSQIGDWAYFEFLKENCKEWPEVEVETDYVEFDNGVEFRIFVTLELWK